MGMEIGEKRGRGGGSTMLLNEDLYGDTKELLLLSSMLICCGKGVGWVNSLPHCKYAANVRKGTIFFLYFFYRFWGIEENHEPSGVGLCESLYRFDGCREIFVLEENQERNEKRIKKWSRKE